MRKEAAVERSFRIWLQVAWTVAILSLLSILGVMIVAIEGLDWRAYLLFVLIPGMLLILSIIVIPMLYYYRKKYAKGIKELTEGKHLAHWKYNPEEWNRFVEGEWARTKKKALWMPFGIVAGVVVLGYLFKGWGIDDFKVILPWIFGLAVFAAMLVYLVGRRTYQKGLEKVGEVYIGERAVQFNETYSTWDFLGGKLGKVEFLQGDPSILQFEILQISRYGNKSSEVRVPVPHNHEEEAKQLAAKLSLS